MQSPVEQHKAERPSLWESAARDIQNFQISPKSLNKQQYKNFILSSIQFKQKYQLVFYIAVFLIWSFLMYYTFPHKFMIFDRKDKSIYKLNYKKLILYSLTLTVFTCFAGWFFLQKKNGKLDTCQSSVCSDTYTF